MTPIDHLHAECEVMLVKAHCEMISNQFLLATQKVDHPNQIDLQAHPPIRLMKKTLRSCFAKDIQHLVPAEGITTKQQYKQGLKTIHTEDVRKTIAMQEPNKILGKPAPAVAKSEKCLNTRARTILTQLRSGYSTNLNSYMSRIDSSVTNHCPDCLGTSHTTDHMFSCPANPTSLSKRDLCGPNQRKLLHFWVC